MAILDYNTWSFHTSMMMEYFLVPLRFLTLISIELSGATAPVQGFKSNSCGAVSRELPTSLILLSTRLSPGLWREPSLTHPSAGTRRLNVIGIREVFTSVQWRVLTNPWNKCILFSVDSNNLIKIPNHVWLIHVYLVEVVIYKSIFEWFIFRSVVLSYDHVQNL